MVSIEAPVSVLGATGCSAMRQFAIAAIGCLGKVAANLAAPAILAGRDEITARLTMIPVIAPAHVPVQPVGIDAKRIGLVVAADVLRHGVSEQPAQDRAADNRAAIAMAGRAADQASGQSAEDGSRRDIALAAVLLIGALLVMAARIFTLTTTGIAAGLALIELASHALILAIMVVIAVLIRWAVIAVRVALAIRFALVIRVALAIRVALLTALLG